ncbi:Multidrug resistance protein MdtH [Clavibacter michiganensis]|uniref:Multidrug resistance protein MdtH n=1 Tax=Clavibacter michiganensis TaxID=28447 RepID=A0A251Y6A8_9MICO|nr:MFS transporter [Clavibacter michiganensis]OUE19814.1 Multidrug resistance protein MdtH [Clavibacter michiganensis]
MDARAGAGRVGTWRRLPAEVRILVLARAVNRLGAFTLPFLTVVLTVDLGASLATAGLVVALFGAATIPSRILGGILADAIGRRSTIALGLTLTAGFQLMLAAAPGIATAAVAAALLGLAFELYEPPSQALVADLVVDDRDRVAAYGLYGAALALAGVLAGLLAAILGGIDLRLLFVADAASCLACAALVLVGLRRLVTVPGADADPPGDAAAPVAGPRSPWRDPLLLAMLASGTGFAVLYLQIDVALPLTLAERGIGPASLGVLLAVSALTIVLGQPLLARGPASRLGSTTAMAVGFVLLGLGFALVGQAADLPGLVAATVVWSLGDLILLGRATALVAAIAPAASRGRYLSAYGVSWGVAAMVAPLLGTQLIARLHAAGTWDALGALCLALALAQPLVAAVARRTGRLPARPARPAT